jgi:hypothetical protein
MQTHCENCNKEVDPIFIRIAGQRTIRICPTCEQELPRQCSRSPEMIPKPKSNVDPNYYCIHCKKNVIPVQKAAGPMVYAKMDLAGDIDPLIPLGNRQTRVCPYCKNEMPLFVEGENDLIWGAAIFIGGLFAAIWFFLWLFVG